MVRERPAVEPPGSHYARRFVVLALATATWCAFAFFSSIGQPLAVATAYLLPFLLAALAVNAFRLLLAGPRAVRTRSFWLGTFFSAGGASFDMLATVIRTPDLSLEQNPIARALLDSGHHSLLVLSYSFVCECLLMAATSALWAAFLSHRPIVVAAASESRTLRQFLRIITGQKRLSPRRWLFPLTHRHLPDPYFLAWLLSVVLIAGSLDRWLLGAGWIAYPSELASEPEIMSVTAFAVVAGVLIYLVSTWRAAGLGRAETPRTSDTCACPQERHPTSRAATV